MTSQNSERLLQLSTRPIGRLLWEYSLPAVVGMLVMALYNVVDRIFIGQWVGPDAIAGLAITFPVMNLTTAIGVLIGVGAAAKVSIMLGAGNNHEANMIFGNAFVLTFINASVYIFFFAVYIDPLLNLFGASSATLPYARGYMLNLLPGCLMTNLAYGLNNIMRASGYPRKAMITMLIGAVVNVVLDPIFIYVLDWGIEGAAWATNIAMAVSTLFVCTHFMRRDAVIRFCKGIYHLKWKLITGIIAIGAAPAIVNTASCVINALVNNSLAGYGTDRDIAAAGIMTTYTSLLVTIILGICQGMQPIIGYNYGAGIYHRLRRTYWLAVAVATLITTAGSITGLCFAREIGMAFANDAALLDATERSLTHCLWAFSFVGFQVISTSLFQSIGQATKSIIVGLLRQVVFLIPLLLILPDFMGVNGVWTSFPISDMVATVVTAILVAIQFRQLFNNVDNTVDKLR